MAAQADEQTDVVQHGRDVEQQSIARTERMLRLQLIEDLPRERAGRSARARALYRYFSPIVWALASTWRSKSACD